MSEKNQGLLELLEKAAAVNFEKDHDSEEKALSLKKYAESKGVPLYVYQDQNQDWCVAKESYYKELAEFYNKHGFVLKTY